MQHKHHKWIKFYTGWIIAALLDIPFFQSLIIPPPNLLTNATSLSILLHVVGTIVLLYSLPQAKPIFSVHRMWFYPAIVLHAFIPVYGWLTIGPLFFFSEKYAPDDIKIRPEEPILLAPSRATALLPGEDVTKRVSNELDFISFEDILSGDDAHLQRGAIERITDIRTPGMIDLLIKSRSHKNAEVRFYINTAISKIKQSFHEELETSRADVMENPEDMQKRLTLAVVYYKLAVSNLFEESIKQTYLDDAKLHATEVWHDAQPVIEAGNLLIDIAQAKEDWNALYRAINEVEQHPLADLACMHQLRCEIMYHKRDFTTLRAGLKKVSEDAKSDDKWRIAAQWWGV